MSILLSYHLKLIFHTEAEWPHFEHFIITTTTWALLIMGSFHTSPPLLIIFSILFLPSLFRTHTIGNILDRNQFASAQNYFNRSIVLVQ